MMRYQIETTTREHITYVANHMRRSDVDEVWASSGMDIGKALEMSVDAGDSWTGLVDGEPICIFGVVPRSMLSESGVPWMLGTDGINRHAKGFLKRCRPVVSRWLESFEMLENYVDSRNTKSVAWLRWLGFTIHPAEPYGPFKIPFHYFTMRRPECVNR